MLEDAADCQLEKSEAKNQKLHLRVPERFLKCFLYMDHFHLFIFILILSKVALQVMDTQPFELGHGHILLENVI